MHAFGRVVLAALLSSCCTAARHANHAQSAAAATTATTSTTQVSGDLIQLNFPENTDLKVLIEYVSQRLDVNILYDEQAVAQKITLRSPKPIPVGSLMGLLESALQMKGLLIVDADQHGWKRIVTAAAMQSAAIPSTRPAGTGSARPGAAVTAVFELSHVDLQKAEQALKPFLTQPGGNAVALPERRLLIVTDYASTVERIAQLLDRLDQPRPPVALEFVPVRHLDAQQLAGQVSQLLSLKLKAQGDAAGAGTAAPDITAEPRTNRLVIAGTAQQVQEAITIVRSIDLPLDLTTRAYEMRAASPERLDRLARDLIGPVDAKRVYRSTVDKESNRLIVTTTLAIHDVVAGLRAEMDVPAAAQQQSPVRFYRLQNTTAVEVLQTIQLIQGQGGASPVAADEQQPVQPPLGATSPIPGANRPPRGADGSLPAPPAYEPEQSEPSPTTAPASPEQGSTLGVQLGNATVTADPNTNMIIVVAPPDAQRVYEQLIRALDRRRPQVLIEVTIVTLDTSDNFSVGVELSTRASIDDTEIISFSSFGLSRVGTGPNLGRLTLNPGLGFNGTVIGSDVADLVIRALVTSGRATVVSAPKILVNDNATGTLASVQEAPFTSINASDTVATTSFAGYASAGTTIALTPHISEGDHLQLEYTVALNSFTDTANSEAGTPPPRQTNQLQSKVTIPDGSTIVVGGLNRRDRRTTKDALPLLGRLPVLEYLFSNRSTTESNSTLFVFIRPVVLRDDQFADLKYYSARDVERAGVEGDYPESEPMITR
jgi:general secretion pathway protein D